jgi:TIR domain
MQTQPASPRLLRIFLCHASEDKSTIQALYQQLEKCNVRPWLDKKELVGGQDWDLEIQKAVRDCDVFIACLTPDFIEKEGYGQKEIKLALDAALAKPEVANYLIPLQLKECKLPERLQRFHAIEYFKEDGFDELIRALRFRIDRKNASLNAGIAPINDQAAGRLAATHSHSQTTSPIVAPSNGGSRGDSVKRVVTIAIALALIGGIAALVWSQVFKLPYDTPSPKATSTQAPAQSGATITFDALGNGSNIIEVYPGVGNTPQDKTYNGTYYNGETIPIVCRITGRTITSNPAIGERHRQSNEWYKLQTPPGAQPEYASAVYADEHGSVPQC